MAFFQMLKKIGCDDPRRIIHALKVALGLTVVSVFYYVNPVFEGLGQPVMWAVLTVVLVMEFTVGAAISKGVNRACATFVAGALGIGTHFLAILFGEKGEPVVLGVVVFSVAASATFARFIPKLKARYDYSVVIFILTFSMVTISSYREDKVLVLAKDRLCTILIGVLLAFFISILVFPVWAGEDLHRLAVSNLEKLANTMEAVAEALEGNKSAFLDGHKGVLQSKSTEDTLANLAWWEPPHGRRFRFRHPWDQYLKLGEESRRCAYLMEALNAYTQTSNKADQFQFDDTKMLIACTELSKESCKALREVASAARSMETPSAAATKRCIDKANRASEEMKTSVLEECEDLEQILNIAPIVSLLDELFSCTQAIVALVEELAKRARFRSSEETSGTAAEKVTPTEGLDHVTIVVVDESSMVSNNERRTKGWVDL